jgi:hypothetical protein
MLSILSLKREKRKIKIKMVGFNGEKAGKQRALVS